MTSKIYVVTDLSPGDGGKGGVVHRICTMMSAHTVIKRGGAQGSHGVRTSGGRSFDFSQWGCGTLDGIPTHLSEQMIITPEGLLNEAAHLRYEQGVFQPFDLLTADRRALCATPFHGIASRLKELARRDHPRGTVGAGVGQAYRAYRQSPELALLAGDLKQPGLRDRLAAIRQAIQSELQPIIAGEFLTGDQAAYDQEVRLLHDDGFLDYVTTRFAELSGQLNVVSHDYLGNEILAKEGVAVVETSHGVLTDRLVGFHPHTSAIRTLPSFSHGMLRNAGYDGKIVNIGITRAYAVRHGAGPMPSADLRLTERLLPQNAADDNRYQGKVRAGPLDFVLLRYAVEACGGPSMFDGLAVTCFDQVQQTGIWQVCDRYHGALDPTLFTPTGAIRVWNGADGNNSNNGISGQLEYQAALGRQLLDCSPEIHQIRLDKDASQHALYGLCAGTMLQSTDIPVRMVSFGPTELDKLCK